MRPGLLTCCAGETIGPVRTPSSRGRGAARAALLLARALVLACALAWSAPARAHDLALDQLMLWPDRGAQLLRGELTLDSELTRGKATPPTPEHGRQLIALLQRELVLTLDGQRIAPDYEVRELWSAGGATLGDLVVFAARLPARARELRVGTGEGLRALIVSVQIANERGADTASWLLGAGDLSPPHALGSAGDSGWRRGGAEMFEAAARAEATASGASATGSGALALRFVRLGVEHILPGGLDHVLFVVGLVLGSGRRYRRVLVSLSLFTLAHSLTLALAHFNVVTLPARWVEPAIALSIAALGLANLRAAPERETRWGRHALVFGFGLIHGLGFAGALSTLSFERAHVVLALASFNVGVELGQAAVVLALALIGGLAQRSALARRHAVPFASMALTVIGLWLTTSRLELLSTAPPNPSPEALR